MHAYTLARIITKIHDAVIPKYPRRNNVTKALRFFLCEYLYTSIHTEYHHLVGKLEGIYIHTDTDVYCIQYAL